ncbi:MAG: hypothetical protein K8I82_12050 [Anaerolineae bacterium]|jgi:hypothetical protein|nr:hypothetical protein [Anaerolineae bacterium]
MITGAIIVQDSPDMDAIISLLSLRMSEQLQYKRYSHAHELNFQEQFDFILLGSFAALERTVHLYQSRGKNPPLIIHLVHPTQLNPSLYTSRFPDVHIIPIAQADLDEMDETLQFLVFETVLRELGER